MAKTLSKLFIVLFISLFFISSPQAFGTNHFSIPKVKVLNQNMYLGADLTPLFVNPELVPAVIGEIIASNYPARAEAFARTIKSLKPDVVCLQEAWIFQVLVSGPDSQLVPLPDYDWDFKQLLLDALGDDYYEVVTNQLFGITVPTDDTTFVRLQDQDVIIANKHAETVGDPKTTIFPINLIQPLPLPPPYHEVKVYRGLSTARIRIRGAEYTIANTHLEPYEPSVRLSQAQQVVLELNEETDPIILAGDFNACPGWPAYEEIITEFVDAWPPRLFGRRDPGLTYGRDDLISDGAIFDERIDFVFIRNQHAITLMGLTIGKTDLSKTAPVLYPTEPPSYVRLWPSDHLGIFFTLILPQ
jgi:endonuclease/exonuclease/phosphatase family metal-dependent hydrolase